MTVDKAALLIVGEKCNRLRDVIRSGEACHRYSSDDVCVGVAAAALVRLIHFGLDPTWADSVYADSSSSPLRCEGPCESDQPMFGNVVGCPISDAYESCDGCYVDDRTMSGIEHPNAEFFR